MLPVTYHLTGDEAIYQGDDYESPLFGLDDFSSVGGPADLTGTAAISAQIRDTEGTLLAQCDVDVEDEVEPTFRLRLASADTANLPILEDFTNVLRYDIQVVDNATWGTKTIFRGRVVVFGQVTQ